MSKWKRHDAPQACANCGKLTGRFIEEIELAPGEPYRGNMSVIRRRRGHAYDHLGLWDGESYRGLAYDPFCTLRCAEEFAGAAWRAGYRRVAK